ncbi:MAG: rhomboid family intramembrane serine protease [Vicinamibacterales bacterium]
MFRRQRSGSVVCASCGSLVGVNDEQCYTCGRRNPSLWGFAPALRSLGGDLGFVTFVVGACAALYVAMLVMSGAGMRMNGLLSLLSPSTDALLLFGASGAIPVFGLGHWWTVASASWLHGGLLHIVLNMMGVRQLGPATAELYGASRMVIIYTIAGICGFLLSSVAGRYLYWMPLPFLRGASLTIGASASIFGLLGAIVYYGRRGGSSAARSHAMSYVVAMVIFGLIVPGIDNYAHAGGFFGGYLAARWLDPLRPERIDHIVGAVVCLGISAVAILLSILKGFEALAAAAVR